MIKKIIITFLTAAAIWMQPVRAQETPDAYKSDRQIMTLDQLIERLVEVNYALEMARLDKSKAQNNVTGAQFMPSLTGTASQRQNTSGRIGKLDEDDDRWSTTNTLGAGLSLSWTLFDGLGMFATHDRQKKLLSISQLNLRRSVENMVSDLASEYYLIISLINRVNVARESMELSQIRYKEALEKYNIGSASGLEMRLAKTDLNADSSNLIKRIEDLDVAYINMNNMLNMDFDRRGYIEDSIMLGERLGYDPLMDNLMEDNTNLLLARSGIDLSDIDVRLAKADRYPRISFGGGYNYNATDNGNFRGTFSNSNGFNWGLNMSVNIFDGLEAKRRLGNARIDQIRSRVNESDVESSVLGSFNSLYTNYTNNLQLIDFETQNTEASRLNLEVAMERFRLGDMSGIDFRTVQQQYLSAVDRKLTVIYQAKVSEISLLRLAGRMVETIWSGDSYN